MTDFISKASYLLAQTVEYESINKVELKAVGNFH